MDESFIIYSRKLNNKYYIGHARGTGTPDEILNNRGGKNGEKYNLNPLFNDAIEKYGWDKVTSKVLLYGLNGDEARNYETYYIMKYKSDKNGYNCNRGEGDQEWAEEMLLKNISPNYKPLFGDFTPKKKYRKRHTHDSVQKFVDYVVDNNIKGINNIKKLAKKWNICITTLNHYMYASSDQVGGKRGNRYNPKFVELWKYNENDDLSIQGLF